MHTDVDTTASPLSIDPQLGTTPLSDEALASAIRGLAATLDAALSRLLALVAEFDERGLWAEDGHRSCAHWLGATDEDGMLLVRVRLPPEQGALLAKALDAAVEQLDADRPLDPADPHPDVSAETSVHGPGVRARLARR